MFAAGKLLLAQIEKRLNERFEALEAARRESEAGWSGLERISGISRRFTAALCPPRGLSSRRAVLEAKLDALYSKIELIQRGNH